MIFSGLGPVESSSIAGGSTSTTSTIDVSSIAGKVDDAIAIAMYVVNISSIAGNVDVDDAIAIAMYIYMYKYSVVDDAGNVNDVIAIAIHIHVHI